MVVVRHSSVRVNCSLLNVGSFWDELGSNCGPVGVENVDSVVESEEVSESIGDCSSQFWDFIDPVA